MKYETAEKLPTKASVEKRNRRHENEDVVEWIEALDSVDLATRREARTALTRAGEAALPLMIDELLEGSFPVRWEIAKALGDMRLAGSVPGLIAALEDEEQDVRWLAAVALAHIGRPSLRPLLERLLARPDSPYLRQGVHHVLAIDPAAKRGAALVHVRDALGPLVGDADLIPAVNAALKELDG